MRRDKVKLQSHGFNDNFYNQKIPIWFLLWLLLYLISKNKQIILSSFLIQNSIVSLFFVPLNELEWSYRFFFHSNATFVLPMHHVNQYQMMLLSHIVTTWLLPAYYYRCSWAMTECWLTNHITWVNATETVVLITKKEWMTTKKENRTFIDTKSTTKIEPVANVDYCTNWYLSIDPVPLEQFVIFWCSSLGVHIM